MTEAEWLAARPVNAIIQHWQSSLGCTFSFGGIPSSSSPSLYAPQFTRGTFHALRERSWIESVKQSDERPCGYSFDARTGEKIVHRSWERWWQITEKGRKVLQA